MDWLDHTEVRQALLSVGSLVLAGLVLYMGIGSVASVGRPDLVAGVVVSFAKLAPLIFLSIALAVAGIAAAYFGLRETGNYRIACMAGLVTNAVLLMVLVGFAGVEIWRAGYFHL